MDIYAVASKLFEKYGTFSPSAELARLQEAIRTPEGIRKFIQIPDPNKADENINKLLAASLGIGAIGTGAVLTKKNVPLGITLAGIGAAGLVPAVVLKVLSKRRRDK